MENEAALPQAPILRDAQPAHRLDLLRRCQLLLLLWLAVLLLLGRREGAQLHNDRAVYASVALTMIESGDWVHPQLAGEPYFKKPPLVFWLAALSALLFGTGPVALSLPSSLSAIGALGMVYLLGRRWLGHAGGIAAAFILVTSPFFIRNAGLLRLDAPQALAVTAAFWAFERGRDRPASLAWGWLFMGLGALSKGAAALLPIPAYAAAAVLCRDAHPFNRRQFWLGLPLFLAALLPWHLAMWEEYGGDFFRVYFGSEQAERVGVPGGMDDLQRVFEGSIYQLLRYHWPWLPFLAVGCWLCIRTAFQGDAAGRGAMRLILAWMAVLALVIVCLRTTFARYLLPIYPAMALVSALPILAWLLPWIRRRWGAGPEAAARLEARGTALAAGALALASTVFAVLPFSFTLERYPEVDLIAGWSRTAPQTPILALPECNKNVIAPLLHANAGLRVRMAEASEILASLDAKGNGSVAFLSKPRRPLPAELQARNPMPLLGGGHFTLHLLVRPPPEKP